jgi:acyl carrier protein
MNTIDIVQAIRVEFDLPDDIDPEMLLIEDLAFDSLRVINLIAFIEELAGIQVGQAPDEYPVLLTVNDAMDYFCELTETKGG